MRTRVNTELDRKRAVWYVEHREAERMKKARTGDPDSNPLLHLINHLPVEIVSEYFGGTALPWVASGFRDLKEGYLLRNESWKIDPRHFMNNNRSWLSFIKMSVPTGEDAELPNDEMIRFHKSVATRLSADGDVDYLTKLRRRLASKNVNIGWASIAEAIMKTAAKNNRVNVMEHMKYVPTLVIAREAGRHGSVEVCAHIYSSARATDRDELERSMTNVMSPEAFVQYETLLNKQVDRNICNYHSAIHAGNIDLVIWMVKNGRSEWNGVIRSIFMECKDSHSSLDYIQKIKKAGCPLTYPYLCYEPDATLFAKFVEIIDQHPSDIFIANCLQMGFVNVLNILHKKRSYLPNDEALKRFLRVPNLKTFEWLEFVGITFETDNLINLSINHIVRTDNLACFEWLYNRQVFDSIPHYITFILELTIAIGAKYISGFLMNNRVDHDIEWDTVVKIFLSVESYMRRDVVFTVDWIFSNGSTDRNDIDGIRNCMSRMKNLQFARVGEITRERVESYCDHLENMLTSSRLNVANMRCMCKEFGVKPQNVRGKSLSSYVDCIRRKYLLLDA